MKNQPSIQAAEMYENFLLAEETASEEIDYTVRWEADIPARGPVKAARRAFASMQESTRADGASSESVLSQISVAVGLRIR